MGQDPADKPADKPADEHQDDAKSAGPSEYPTIGVDNVVEGENPDV
jgi:hypothetical protein